MVIIFCLLLILGILTSQFLNLLIIKDALGIITSVCLSYIMIEVGFEFSTSKRTISSYRWDFFVALSAALLPALLWFAYFNVFIHNQWQPSIIAGLSSAPTSAGVLFAMLMAAGLSATWVFEKARTLAVLDDLVVILLLVPLQIIIHGFDWGSIAVLIIIIGFLSASFRFQNSIFLPLGDRWFLLYGFILSAILLVIKNTTHIHLEVLIPAFMLGCIIHHQGQHQNCDPKNNALSLDTIVKGLFMFCVGASFPKIAIGDISISTTMGHVLMLTLLANLGKCFPMLCYRKEVPLKERLALSIAMFPRGEVGAAVLLIGLGYGFGGYVTTLAMLSLAFNLVLTGIFVFIVVKILDKK